MAQDQPEGHPDQAARGPRGVGVTPGRGPRQRAASHGERRRGVGKSVTLPPFQSLLDAQAPDLYRFLVAAVGRHDGDDLFQETVISALRSYPGLPHADNLRGWLFTIAHRKV